MDGNHNQFFEQNMSHCPTQGKYSLSLKPLCWVFSFIFPWWVPPLYQTPYFTIFSYKIKRMFATLESIPKIIKRTILVESNKMSCPKIFTFFF